MRLRTRLTLAFAALAILPAILVSWATLSSVQASFEDMLEQRLDDVEALLRSEIDRAVADLSRTVSALASATPSVERLSHEVRRGTVDPASTLPLGERLMSGRHDLQALVLIDSGGRVLSSGHLPARSGDIAPELAGLARDRSGEAALRWIEVQRDFGIEKAPAILVSMPAGGGSAERAPVHVIGGRMIDQDFASRLGSLTGAEVRLILEAEEPGDHNGAHGGERFRRLPVTSDRAGESTQIEFAVSERGLRQAQARILAMLGGSAVLVVLAAALLGAVLASRITRPIDALAKGAERISRGGYEPVEAGAPSGETAALVEAFNSMIVEIRASQERIAAAERIAAWQGIARRLAHEIKNPLTPIAMSIETLRRTWKRKHPQFEEIFAESTQAILEEVGALERLVTEFSRFARLPAPSLKPEDPAELIESALALFPEPPAKVRLEKDIAAGLPKIMADRDQLGQVLLNLVTNALQAVESKAQSPGGLVTLRAFLSDRGRAVSMEVRDDGPGIEAEHKAELFTPYFTTKESGTGLGLAICHRIVSEHGGRISVESEPGGGARFMVQLPAAPAATG